MKPKKLLLGYSKILVLFLVGILCISTVSNALAATQSELTRAYEKGYESGKSNSNCSTAGSNDDKNNKSPDPGYAADQILLTVEKPYLSTHVLYPNWVSGFVVGCSEYYFTGFVDASNKKGAFDQVAWDECYKKGYSDAESGKYTDLVEFSRSLAEKQPSGNLPTIEQHEAYISGFFQQCERTYNGGLDKFNYDKTKLNDSEEKGFDGDALGDILGQMTESVEKGVANPLKENVDSMANELGKGLAEQMVPDISSGCLIATATYGSELSPEVQQLRELRDNTLLQTNSGSAFMTGFNQFYYSFSPTIADWERQNSIFKEAVKLFITPLIASLSILNYVDMDSEAEVLGYGISLILLNIGMYFVAPVGIGLVIIRKI